MTGAPDTVVLEREPELASQGDADLQPEVWNSLAERAENVFSTWDWSDVWWRHFGRGKKREVITVERDEATVAVLPLYEQRLRGARTLRFLGGGVADQLGPVCGPADRSAAIERLRELMGARILLAERMPDDRDWAPALGGKLVHREASPIIDLAGEGGWEAYLANRSANFRQQVRRRARRLTGGEGVRYRLTEDHSTLQSDLDALFALHAARWGGRSDAFVGARGAFHREFAARALERGWLRLWLAEIDGTPAAAWYGLRFAGAESFYQSGRDPGRDRSQVGAGLLEHTIRMACEDGMRQYRLLRGEEQYKRRYATIEADVCTIAAARRPIGRTAVAALDLLLHSRIGRALLGSTT
jgi:CelD/BcsL family acetyltransferase involved in cellulose biosynthesis